MNTYKSKFTQLQNETFRALCINTGKALNQREIAKILNVSPTAVANAVKVLEKEGLAVVKKDKNMNLNLVELNRGSQRVMGLKRAENLKMVYESGIVEFLEGNYPGAIIILFGSYSYGEDTTNSDIDIAVIGGKDKILELKSYNEFFEKEINIHVYRNFNEVHKHLRSNIFNGIILVGRINL